MPKINILDSKVWSKIAAGEVVERPAAALKELIENSIDAQSTMISIEVEEGGTKKIKVTDNGCGIEKEDIANAFVCHATSKIFSEKDLEAIGTLGFRGEALSSIAAVSHVTMTSKTAQTETATKIVIEAGEIKSIEEVSAPVGTTVLIENLFFNVPARIKFLKKPRYEEQDIASTVSRLILANPNISIKLTTNGKVVYATNGRGLEDAIFEVYGKETFSNLIAVKHERDGIIVHGFVGNKNIAKSNRTFQTLTINGRYVKNIMVSSAVQNAYESFLMKGQFPFYVLALHLPFESVDVNVHPNKMEVKFEQGNHIFLLFNQAVFGALAESDFVAKPFNNFANQNQSERPKVNPFVFPTEFLQNKSNLDAQTTTQTSKPSNEFSEILEEVVLPNTPILELRSVNSIGDEIEVEEVPKRELPVQTLQTKMFSDVLNYKIVGTAFETYIMVQQNERLLIIDQHAAHERELYDIIMQEIQTQNISKQDMLLPYIREVSLEETAFLEQNISIFEKSGFEIDFFGKNTIRISAVPYVLKDIDLGNFVSQVLSNISVIANKPYDYAINKFATMACKAAIKAGQILSQKEIEALLSELSKNKVLLCPHGRPIVVEVTKKDMEKWFKRIV